MVQSRGGLHKVFLNGTLACQAVDHTYGTGRAGYGFFVQSTGGAGADTLTGGAGADTYIYTAQGDSGTLADTFDIVTDFDVASDKFDLTALLESDEFEFLDAEGTAFSGNGPEVRWDKDAGKTTVEIDIDGDGNADMKFELDDEVDLTDSNFLV